MTAMMLAQSVAALSTELVVAEFTMTAGEDGSDSGYSDSPAIGSLSVDDAYRGITINKIQFETAGADSMIIEFDTHVGGNFFHTIEIVGLDWNEIFTMGGCLDNGTNAEVIELTTPDRTHWIYQNQVSAHDEFTDTEVYTIKITQLPKTIVKTFTAEDPGGDDSGFQSAAFGGPIGTMSDTTFFGTDFELIRYDHVLDLFRISFNENLSSSGQQLQSMWKSVRVEGDQWDETFVAASATNFNHGTLIDWEFSLIHARFQDNEVYTCTFTMR